MRKGQGSLEYLLILAAILAIAVVVVVVANSMLAPAQQSGVIQQAKYECGLQGIDLVGLKQISQFTDTTATKSLVITKNWGFGDISYQGLQCSQSTGSVDPVTASCQVGYEGSFYEFDVHKTSVTQCEFSYKSL